MSLSQAAPVALEQQATVLMWAPPFQLLATSSRRASSEAAQEAAVSDFPKDLILQQVLMQKQ
jgi:hypothetical protein